MAGYGSGKTTASVYRLLYKVFKHKSNVAYYLPTYDLITLIAYPAFSDALEEAELSFSINRQEKTIYLHDLGCEIILRTMDRPERIVGYQVADSVIDELDTLPMDKAADVWRKVVARNRLKVEGGNSIAVATTPEGFRFVYENWQRNPMQGSRIIKASTHSNMVNLPDDYISNLEATYPSQMLQAYLEGEFVNLTSGRVYPEFDRDIQVSTESIKPGETLHVGMDFNVGQMAAAIHVLRGTGDAHAVAEAVGLLDTPAMISYLQREYPNHPIMVYPDASGKSRKTVNASESDLALLRQAKFTVLANSRNPFIKDRVAAVNKAFKDSKYYVNIATCPHIVEGLEKQAYNKSGEPDKTSGLDHILDGLGYFISYKYPVTGGKASQFKLKGV